MIFTLWQIDQKDYFYFMTNQSKKLFLLYDQSIKKINPRDWSCLKQLSNQGFSLTLTWLICLKRKDWKITKLVLWNIRLIRKRGVLSYIEDIIFLYSSTQWCICCGICGCRVSSSTSPYRTRSSSMAGGNLDPNEEPTDIWRIMEFPLPLLWLFIPRVCSWK